MQKAILVTPCCEPWQPRKLAHDDFAAARKTAQEAAERCRVLFGEDDWGTFDARQLVTDIGLQEKLSADERDRLRAAHRDYTRAQQLRLEGKASEALPLAESAHKTRAELLGRHHPRAMEALNAVALLHTALGDDQASLKASQEVLQGREATLPASHPDLCLGVFNLAAAQENVNDYEQAKAGYLRAAALYEKIYGRDTNNVANALNAAGQVSYYNRDYENALKLQKESLAIYEKILPADSEQLSWSYGNVASDYYSLEDYSKAAEFRRRELAILEKLYPEGSRTAGCLNRLGSALYSASQYAEALAVQKRALSIREKLLGPDHVEVANSLAWVATNYIELGDYLQAKVVRERAYAIRKESLGPEHLDTIQSLSDLGASYDRLGNVARARELYEQSLALREKHLGPDDRLVGFSLNNLCLLYCRMGLPAESEKAGLRALAIFEKTAGKDSPDTALCLNSLGLLYNSRVDYFRARLHFARALAIRERTLGPGHPQTGTSLNNLALVHMNLRDYAQAIPLFTRALEIGRKFNGEEHPETTLYMANLGWAATRLGQLETARQWYTASLAARRKALGNDHYDTAHNLDQLAMVLRRQGKLDEALPLCLEGLETRQKVLPPEHPSIAESHEELALIYERLSDPRAEEQYLKALAIREKAYGASAPSVATTLTNLGSLYQSRKDFAAAKPLYQRALAICQKHLELVSELQAERQQLAMSGAYRWHLDWYVDLVAESGQDADNLYAYVLAWKGAVLARQRLARLGEQAGDPQVATTLQALRETSGRLAALVLDVPSEEGRSNWRDKIAQLTNDRQRLEEELSRLSGQFRQQRAQESVTAAQIQAALPEDAVLVDLLEFSHQTSVEKNEYETRLVAFIVKPLGSVQLVPLGAAQPLYAAVDAWRGTYGGAHEQGSPQSLRRLLWEPLAAHVGNAQTLLISPDGGLGRFPWPALPVDEAGQYLIERMGVAVVPVPQLIPALAASSAGEPAQSSLCLVGDVDFGAEAGSSSDQLAARTAAGGRAGVLRKWPALPATRAEILAVGDSFETRHPGSRVEVLRKANATEQQLRQFAAKSRFLHLATHGFFAPAELKTVLSAPIDVAGQRHASVSPPAGSPDLPQLAGIGAALEIKDNKLLTSQVLPDGAAGLDGRLKAGDRLAAIAEADGEFVPLEGLSLSDAVAHIRGKVETRVRLKVVPADGSAGYVLELSRRLLPRDEQGVMSIETLHPGLLSGIVLAGANHPPDPSKDDGVLTALEVADLDLRQLELATLSACETGLGATANGEGLLGLQRAFQVAGARSVVASLWKVDDDASRDLMERFYENLWTKEMGKLKALRKAQLWMLRERGPRGLTRIQGDDAPQNRLPPYYWAAFVLSGDWR